MRGRECVFANLHHSFVNRFLGSASAYGQQVAASVGDLSRLSIDELANLPVTGVTRTLQPLSQAPAAVFVITNDDIRRSGATTLAEALRLAPNLQVARADAANYGITARGFNHNSATANKLQVMIDGRIVYTPLYSGCSGTNRTFRSPTSTASR
jgi:iron complex outermembrane receptor protein